MNRPLIYIVILNYNSSQDTIELFEQLEQIDYPNYQILIIDNKSTDNSAEKISENIPKSSLILHDKNLGYAAGNNIGIKRALENNADYIWILNPDIRVEKNTLSIMLGSFSNFSKVAAVGSRQCYRTNKNLVYSDGGIIIPEKGFQIDLLNYHKSVHECSQLENIHPVDYVSGSSLLINSECLQEVGFMREDFFLYFEETEWCLRAHDLGWQLLVNSKAITYLVSSDNGWRYSFYMSRNKIWLSKIKKKYEFKTVVSEIKSLVRHAIRRGRDFNKGPLETFVLYTAKVFGVILGTITNPRHK